MAPSSLSVCALPLIVFLVGTLRVYPEYKSKRTAALNAAAAFQACEQALESQALADSRQRTSFYTAERHLDDHSRLPRQSADEQSLALADTVVCVTFLYEGVPCVRCNQLGDCWSYPGETDFCMTADVVLVDWPSGKLVTSIERVGSQGGDSNSCGYATPRWHHIVSEINRRLGEEVYAVPGTMD